MKNTSNSIENIHTLFCFVGHTTGRTSKRTVIRMYFWYMNYIISFINESHITISAFMLFFCEMSWNMSIQILLRIKSCSTRDTFEILKKEYLLIIIIIYIFPSNFYDMLYIWQTPKKIHKSILKFFKVSYFMKVFWVLPLTF